MSWNKAVLICGVIFSVGCTKEEQQEKHLPRMAPSPILIEADMPRYGSYEAQRFTKTENLDFRDQLEALPDIEVKTDEKGHVVWVDFRKAGGGKGDQLAWLYGLPFVETLIISGEQIDNKIIGALAGHPRLRVLNIALKSSVDQDGLAPLSSFVKLEDISLEGSKVNDDSLEHLAKVKTIRKLRLRKTGITAAGIKKLTDLNDLELLDLRDCNDIGDSGLETIATFKKLKSLLVNGEQVTDAGMSHLSALTELQLLVLPRSQVTDTGIAALSGIKKLKELDLFQAPISAAGLAVLAESKDMVKLKIRGTKVTSEGLRMLEGFKKLAELDLGETLIDDAAIDFISACESLVDVNLLRTGITAQGIEKLARLKLKRLNLDDVRGVDNACLKAIGSIDSLEFLHLGKTAISDEGVSALTQLKGLKSLILENTQISPGKIEELRAALPNTEIKYEVAEPAAG